jgi:hypothetical protein
VATPMNEIFERVKIRSWFIGREQYVTSNHHNSVRTAETP